MKTPYEQIVALDDQLCRSFHFGEERALSDLHVYYQPDQKCYLFSIKVNSNGPEGYIIRDGVKLMEALKPLLGSEAYSEASQLPAWGMEYRVGNASSTLLLHSTRPNDLIAMLHEKGGLSVPQKHAVIAGLESLKAQVEVTLPQREGYVKRIEEERAARVEAYLAGEVLGR